jgi:predicted nucleic acid-binding protein
MILYFDASSIIAFMTEMDDGEYLHSLIGHGFKLVITEEVSAEIKKEPGVSRLKKAIAEKWISVETVPIPKLRDFKNKHPNLDYAEIGVLLTGLSLEQSGKNYCCVLDEGPGRKIADSLRLKRTGTKGLLKMLNDLKIIDKETKENLLSKLERSPFRL